MLRILHLSDLHLGWEPSYMDSVSKNIRIKERNGLLEKAVDYALSSQSNIHAVIIAGDLFEHYKPADSLVRETIYQIDRLVTAGIFTVTVPGNHDEITYRDSVYRQYNDKWPGELVRNPMPELVASKDIAGTKLNVYSLAYTGGLTNVSKVEKFPREDIAGLHIGVFHGSLDWSGLPDRSLPITSSQLKSAGYDYVALGHYHRYSEQKIDQGIAVYAGAVEFKSFNDPGVGFLTVAQYDGKSFSVQKVELPTRVNQAKELDISHLNNINELIDECRKFSDPESMVQLSLKGVPGFQFYPDKIAEDLERDFFYLEIINDTQFFDEAFLEGISQEPTIRGAYVRRFQEKNNKDLDDRGKKVFKKALLKGLAAIQGSDNG